MTEAIKAEQGEKIIYLADDLGSIMTLKDLIDDIRNNRLRNFIVVAQADRAKETEITLGPDIPGEVVIKYYFFGKDSSTLHVGLCNRMAHLLNQYMDGHDVFGKGEAEDWE